MSKIDEIKKFYVKCMGCSNTEAQCPSIVKTNVSPPRGFYFENTDIDMLIVSKNPGTLRQGDRYRNKTGTELFDSYYQWKSKLVEDEDSKTTYHRNLDRYITYFINPIPLMDYDAKRPINNDIYKKVAFTNLVKCSTKGEQDKLNPKTMKECFGNYLKEEVRLFSPKVILGLGREVSKFLIKRKDELGIPIIHIKHPSYFYKKDKEKDELYKIKREILLYL